VRKFGISWSIGRAFRMKNYLAFLIFAAFTLSVEADILLQQDLSNETADLFLSKEPVKSEIGFRMTADLSSRLGGDTLRGVAFGLVCEEDLEVRAQEPEHNSNIRNFNSYEFDLGAMSLICGHVGNSHILWEDDRAEPIFLRRL